MQNYAVKTLQSRKCLIILQIIKMQVNHSTNFVENIFNSFVKNWQSLKIHLFSRFQVVNRPINYLEISWNILIGIYLQCDF